jgi:hypothetical protein
MENETVKIVVLPDGTWQTVNGCAVWTITEEAFNALCEGDKEAFDLVDGADILATKDVDT